MFIYCLTMLICMIPSFFDTSERQVLIDGENIIGGFSKVLDDLERSYDKHDLEILSAVMELENGCNSDECLLWTGSVLMNRAMYCKWCPDTLEECVLQNYGKKGQQYASHTVENLYTVEVSNRVYNLAKQLLIWGQVCPPEYVFQSMYPHLGRNQVKIDTEYFATD